MGLFSLFRPALNSSQFPAPDAAPRPEFTIPEHLRADNDRARQRMQDVWDMRDQRSQEELDFRKARFKMPRTIEDIRDW